MVSGVAYEKDEGDRMKDENDSHPFFCPTSYDVYIC